MANTRDLASTDESTARADLRRSRTSIGHLTARPEGGVYAIYLRTRAGLRPFAEGEDGLIYIGLSRNLADREFDQHFSSGDTGWSTLRRSLGALLRDEPSLHAFPRAPGPSESNVRNYRFSEDGEVRLTNWMCAHVEVGVHVSEKYLELETFLVREMRPLLNLTKWRNPYRADIKRLRKVCADEARVARRIGEVTSVTATKRPLVVRSGKTTADRHGSGQ